MTGYREKAHTDGDKTANSEVGSSVPANNGNAGGTRLVIVESPAKAKTIAGYLGRGYVVESSIGHIRDLPGKGRHAGPGGVREPGLGQARRERRRRLRAALHRQQRQEVAGLEAEAASERGRRALPSRRTRTARARPSRGTCARCLKPKVPVHRMVFHEITPQAIRDAVANPRDLNLRLVDAQETRRILDRLYGFEVSPVLWKKVKQGLSAGRVQSVATRLVVERERERIAFTSASYWDLSAAFDTGLDSDDPSRFGATLLSVAGTRVAQGRDFGSDGLLTRQDVLHLDQAAATALAGRLDGASYSGTVGRAQAVHEEALCAVPDDDPPAGGEPEAGVLGEVRHAGGPEALRERVHHLHAYRQHHAVGDRRRRGAQPGDQALRRGLRARQAEGLRQQGQERAGGPRGDPPVG